MMDQPDIDIKRETAGPQHETQVAAQQAASADRALWAQFAEASTAEVFCQSWLAIQCRNIRGVRGALVLVGPPGHGPFTPAAVWPSSKQNLKYLITTAEQALKEARGLLIKREPNGEAGVPSYSRFDVAYPIQLEGKLCGVVVLDVTPRPKSDLQGVLRQLHWGSGWLENLFRREQAGSDAAIKERMQTVLDLVGTAVSHDRFRAAATAFATELATRLSCDRVSVGLVPNGQVRLQAMSHSAQFDKKTNLVRAVEAAMDEALDQKETLVYPPIPTRPTQVTRAHADLAREYGSGAITSVPLMEGDKSVGVLTLERPEDHPFDPQTLELCEGLSALIGPVLEIKHRDDHWIGKKIFLSCRAQLAALFGPRHLVLKLGVLGITGLIAFLAFFTTTFHVTATTVTEGLVQRAAVAPFDGYIATAPIKAGDAVTAGQVLATLEDRELKLEHLRWISQLEQVQKEYRQAMADRDAAQVEITSAQMSQARAQLALVEDRLSRTQIMAPFDGVVVTGDLTRSLGAPVEQGQTLFEVAPLDAYRMILQVDERDITYVEVGQPGQLLLSAMPNDPLSFEITKITPVSKAEEGLNYFRVEARLTSEHQRLRPGMEGVGKIEIELRLLVWTLTRAAADWLRLELWRWMP